MIRYALACGGGHEFEGWFSASADYDDQAGRGLLTCPVCNTRQVRKQIMAPAVSGTTKRDWAENPAATRAKVMEAMTRVRQHVETHFDYVGDSFAREARAIHEGMAEGGSYIAPIPPIPPIPPISGGKIVSGTLNGGGPDIQIATMNGDITLRKAVSTPSSGK